MAQGVLVETVIPALAVVVFLTMAASPTGTVWRTRKRSDIGDFNPLPNAVLVGNTCVWNVYGAITKDHFVTTSSGGALLIAVFNYVIVSAQARQRTRDRLLALLLAYLFAVLLMGALTALIPLTASTAKTLWGVAANAGSVLYYTSPLSTLRKVVRTRDSASIHVGNAVMSVVNCALWIVYFVAKGDYVVPTSTYYLGACFNLVCLALCWAYPRRKPGGEELEREAEAGGAAPRSHTTSLARTSSGGLSLRGSRDPSVQAGGGRAQPDGAGAASRAGSWQLPSRHHARGHAGHAEHEQTRAGPAGQVELGGAELAASHAPHNPFHHTSLVPSLHPLPIIEVSANPGPPAPFPLLGSAATSATTAYTSTAGIA